MDEFVQCPKCGGKVLADKLPIHLKMMCPARNMPDGEFNSVRNFSRAYGMLKLLDKNITTFTAGRAIARHAVKPMGIPVEMSVPVGSTGHFTVRNSKALAADDNFIFFREGGVLYSRCGDVLREQLEEADGVEVEFGNDSIARYEIDRRTFNTIASRVAYSASKVDDRPVLTGVYFTFAGGQFEAAAADGFRLSSLEWQSIVTEEEQSFIVPAKVVELVASLEKGQNVIAKFSHNRVQFTVGDVEVRTALIAGTFPDYRSILKDLEREAVFDAEEPPAITEGLSDEEHARLSFRWTMYRERKPVEFRVNGPLLQDIIDTFGCDKEDAVYFKVEDGSVSVRTLGTEGSGIKHPVSAEAVEGSGYIAFKFKYLQAILKTTSGGILIRWISPALATLFDDSPAKHLLMPMFINWKEVLNEEVAGAGVEDAKEPEEGGDSGDGAGEEPDGEPVEGDGELG